MNTQDVQREVKHIKGLAMVLNKIADEVSERNCFTPESVELLKTVGSALLFKGVALPYRGLKEESITRGTK